MNNKDKAQIISKDELLQGDWTPIRNEVWSSELLSPNAKLCYIAIAAHVWKKDDKVAWPGQQRLAKLIGVSDRSIRTYLTELEDAKLLVIDRRGLNMTNNYYICKPKTDILKPLWDTDRKQASTQERKRASTPDRKQASDKEQAVKEQKVKNKTTTNPPIREKDAQIGISDGGDIIDGGINSSIDSDVSSDNHIVVDSETPRIGGEINDVISNRTGNRNRDGSDNNPVNNVGELERLTYVQGVVDYFNGLKAKHPTKISQRTTRPAKLQSVDKYAKGKYRAALHWHTEGIPLEQICEALDVWVGAHAGAPVLLNYFANHKFPEPDVPQEHLDYIDKLWEDKDEHDESITPPD